MIRTLARWGLGLFLLSALGGWMVLAVGSERAQQLLLPWFSQAAGFGLYVFLAWVVLRFVVKR